MLSNTYLKYIVAKISQLFRIRPSIESKGITTPLLTSTPKRFWEEETTRQKNQEIEKSSGSA